MNRIFWTAMTLRVYPLPEPSSWFLRWGCSDCGHPTAHSWARPMSLSGWTFGGNTAFFSSLSDNEELYELLRGGFDPEK